MTKDKKDETKKPSKLKVLLGKIKASLGVVGTQIGIAIGEAKFGGN